ncbi:hypothetical protein ONZ45_g9706 [Pleurotus djamor]|nr:hypothetical protein ONZ45_g9706 [Pleurotus djamor]
MTIGAIISETNSKPALLLVLRNRLAYSQGRMYSSYLDYFKNILRHDDFSRVLEKYVFSETEMLSRFLGGLFHPVIFIGYGCEFRIPGILAEGLALTAVHPPVAAAIIPLSRCALDRPPRHSSAPIHVLCILDRIMKDETIRGGNHKVGLLGYKMYHWVVEHAGDVISKHVDDWADFDATNTDVVARKTEEIHWLATLLYAMSGFQAAQEDLNFFFKADFFTAHLVTSALFLPSITAFLKPASKRTFLRAYLYTGLVWWISRGKRLDVDGFFSVDVDVRVDVASSQSPSTNGTNDRGGDTVHDKDSSQFVWSRIIKHAIHHPDDHLIKCQRSLYHFSSMYRHSQPFSAVKVAGFERLDSSLFLRAAILTAHRLENPPKGALKCWDVN